MDVTSFTGVKNPGGIKFMIGEHGIQRIDRLLMQLNDKGNKDLSDFKKYFANCLNKNDEDLLQIDAIKYENAGQNQICINGFPLVASLENLPFIGKLVKLIETNIVEKPEEQFIFSESYFYGREFFNKAIKMLKNEEEVVKTATSDMVHEPEAIKGIAENVLDSFQSVKQSLWAFYN